MTRPQRHKKGDRLTYPGASAEEVRCDYALAPFDRAALDSERVWGIDRLPGLVSPELAERYGRAIAHLNDRIAAHDPEGTAAAATNCVRGLAAMDAAARAAGHAPAPADVWQVEVGGKICGIIREAGDWPTVEAATAGLRLYTLHEVAIALDALGQAVAAAKDAFPGATVAAVRHRSEIEESLDDEIPW